MTMLDMMFNEQEKKKMMEGFGQVLTLAVQRGIEASIGNIEQAVERVLVKNGVVMDTEEDFTPIHTTKSPVPPRCSCGLDSSHNPKCDFAVWYNQQA